VSFLFGRRPRFLALALARADDCDGGIASFISIFTEDLLQDGCRDAKGRAEAMKSYKRGTSNGRSPARQSPCGWILQIAL
jgi:hypothetical protein